MDLIQKENDNQRPEGDRLLIYLRDMEKLVLNEAALIFGENASLSDQVPKVEMNHGELMVRFLMPDFHIGHLSFVLKTAKRYMENIRINAWLTDEYRFQSLGDNLYQIKNITDQFYFQIQGTLGYYHFQARKKSAFAADEAHFILDIFRMAHQKREEQTPEERLQELGVQVYRQGLSWDAIGGYELVKREVMEGVVLPFQHKEIYAKIMEKTRGSAGAGRGNRPRAILFTGPPGVGKTTMARIISKEVGVPLLYIPIESIISKYYGESSKNLMSIFELAARMDSAIFFLDEIDSLAGNRDAQMFEATRRVLSVLLRYLDGFESKGDILTLAATNRPKDLDSALLSRFDHTIRFDLPNTSERRLILKGYARHLQEEELVKLAQMTEEFSGRNLKDLCDYAERWWARHLILQKKDVSTPPLEAYIKSVETRRLDDSR